MPESKALRRVIAGLYWEKPQRGYRVRETCIAAENSHVTGIVGLGLNHSLTFWEARMNDGIARIINGKPEWPLVLVRACV